MVDSDNTSLTGTNSPFSFSNIEKNSLTNIRTKPKSKTSLKSNENQEIIEIISETLIKICEENSSLSSSDINGDNTKNILKPFFSKKIPSISILDYLKRLSKYNKMNNSTLIMMLIYIDRFCEKNKIKINFFIIHKLILASLVSAIKFNEDEYYSMDYYSKSGGVSKKEIIYLEYKFMTLIDFKFFVHNDLFEKYKKYLTKCEEDEDSENELEEENENQKLNYVDDKINDNNNNKDENDDDDE